jgi:hypothetical protein
VLLYLLVSAWIAQDMTQGSQSLHPVVAIGSRQSRSALALVIAIESSLAIESALAIESSLAIESALAIGSLAIVHYVHPAPPS